MPVILRKDTMWDWLLETNQTALVSMLQPAPVDWLRAWEVSRAVNDARQYNSECAAPLPGGRE